MKTTIWFVMIFMDCSLAAEVAKPVYTGWLSKLAIGGYDAALFFLETGPVKGRRDFTAE